MYEQYQEQEKEMEEAITPRFGMKMAGKQEDANGKSKSTAVVRDRVGIALQLGQRVFLDGTKQGILRTMGNVAFSQGMWCGVELTRPEGKNDGTVQGLQYFCCEPLHGIFVRPGRLTHVYIPNYIDINSANVYQNSQRGGTTGPCVDCREEGGRRKRCSACQAKNGNDDASQYNSPDIRKTSAAFVTGKRNVKEASTHEKTEDHSFLTNTEETDAIVSQRRRSTYVIMMENDGHEMMAPRMHASKGKSVPHTENNSSLPGTPSIQRRYEKPTFSSSQGVSSKVPVPSYQTPPPFSPAKIVNEYEVSSLLRAHDDLQEEKQKLTKEVTTNSNSLKKALVENNGFRMSQVELKNAIIELQEKLLMKDIKIESIQDERHELETQIGAMKEQMSHLQDKAEEIQLLSSMLKRTKEELVAAKDSSRIETESKNAMKAEKKEFMAEHAKQMQMLNDRNAEFKLTVDKLERKLHERDAEIENQLMTNRKKEHSISSLTVQLAALQSAQLESSESLSSVERDIKHREKLLEKAESQLMEKESTIQKQIKDINNLKHTIESQSQEIENIKRSNVHLASKCKATYMEVESLFEGAGVGVVKGVSSAGDISPWTSLNSIRAEVKQNQLNEEIENKVKGLKEKHAKELSKIQMETEKAVGQAEERSKKTYQQALEKELSLEQQLQAANDKLMGKERELYKLEGEVERLQHENQHEKESVSFGEKLKNADRVKELENMLEEQKKLFEHEIEKEHHQESDLEDLCNTLRKNLSEKEEMIKTLGMEIARLSSVKDSAEKSNSKLDDDEYGRHEHLLEELDLKNERIKVMQLEIDTLKFQRRNSVIQRTLGENETSGSENLKALQEEVDQKNALIKDLKNEIFEIRTKKLSEEDGNPNIEVLLKDLGAKESVIRGIVEALNSKSETKEMPSLQQTSEGDGQDLKALCSQLQEELSFRENVMKDIQTKLEGIEMNTTNDGMSSQSTSHSLELSKPNTKEKDEEINRLKEEITLLHQTITALSQGKTAGTADLQEDLRESKATIACLKEKLSRTESKYEREYRKRLHEELENVYGMPEEITSLRKMLDMKNYLIAQLRAEIDTLAPQARRASALESELMKSEQSVDNLKTIVESQALVQSYKNLEQKNSMTPVSK
eukprot:Nk52_evm10s245 gene=Nk52_evmTU10s245